MKTNLKLFTLAVFALVSMFFVTASMAQTSTTGTVEGVVADATGAVVPGAALTLSGGNLIAPLNATSKEDGSYQFLQVPPGRYTLSVGTTKGFAAYKQDNIEVNLSRSTAVNVTLAASGGNVNVEVVATSEVDQSSNTTGANISTEFFSNIPTSRTVQGLYTIAPTVARSGLRDASGRDRDPSVGGSSGPENSYILDGVTTTDPAFGGGGANLPFEFVQEVEIKTGNYGADSGLSTGGIFNVITKSGGNTVHGDVFAYLGAKSLVAKTKNFPFTGLAPNGFSDLDAGFDIGGPIKKEKLWFFGAFNPQFRTNHYLTQTFRAPVEGKIKTPFYAGKISWLLNSKNTLTLSTFGDFTKETGHLFAGTGFGANLASFRGTRETGGTNYAARLNSNMSSTMIGEFSFGIHRQRNNILPEASVANSALVTDTFAILQSNGSVANVTHTGFNINATGTPTSITQNVNQNFGRTGFVDYVFAPGGSLQRNFVQDGFGVFQTQDRNRWEAAAKMQKLVNQHTFKFGFEFYNNAYDIDQDTTGPNQVFGNPFGMPFAGGADNNSLSGWRLTNNFIVCTTRTIAGVGTVVCPANTGAQAVNPSPGTVIFNSLPVNLRPAGFTANAIDGTLTAAEVNNNPFLIRGSTRVRDFRLSAKTKTRVESFYFQDDYKVHKYFQVNLGLRWDYQQAQGNGGEQFIRLNNFWQNMQPRVGFIWDFRHNGKSKFFMNASRYLETPIPLDANVRAGSSDTQTDKQFNISTYGTNANSVVVPGISSFFCTSLNRASSNCTLPANAGTIQVTNTNGAVNLGAEATPIDAGLKPPTVNEYTAGFEFEVANNLVMGFRGIYRAQGSVIEDGSFDDGNNYFLFNPGEPLAPGPGGEFGNTEYQACHNPAIGCFGRARRYYRAFEFTLNRRFANKFSYNLSYVFSSLTGNYEGLFRNDNGQSDPNITSLFDLVSLLRNTYGRLPNDRPHQFKFNGSYQTPWRLVLSGNFYAQSGIVFNQLIPHPIYGNNEGFAVQRGTAIIPANFPGGIKSGTNRSPFTWNLDLGAYVPFKVGEGKEFRITADWFNVTNAQRAVTLDQTYSINSGVSGVDALVNPFWGSGTIFQYPAALRLGAKFRF